MCFSVVTHCLSYCIKPAIATKIIGWIYTVLSFMMVVLFGVPAAAPHSELPPQRGYFYTCLAVSSAVLLLFSLLLLCAAHKRVPALMWPWVAWAWTTGALLIVVCIVGIVTLPYRYDDDAAEEPYVIALYFIYATFLIFSAMVVHTHRKEVVQKLHQPVSREDVKLVDEVGADEEAGRRRAQNTGEQSHSSCTCLV